VNRVRSRGRAEARRGDDANSADELRQWMASGYCKLNVGGGPKNLEGFVNIDFVRHPSVRRGIRANILDLSFVPDVSMTHIHSNHVLEHLTEEEIRHQLLEYRRILRRDGLFTLRCPNALGGAYGFWFPPVIESEREEFQRLGFPSDEDLANPDDAWIHRDFYGVLHWFFGDMGNVENQHLTLLTPTKVQRLLREAGLTILKTAEPEAVNIVIVARNS
jgi:SAM-dependent methyltransferase